MYNPGQPALAKPPERLIFRKTPMPRFTLLPAATFDLDHRDWAANEQQLIDASVRQQGGVALVHSGRDGIVVPRSYRHKPGFADACAALAADGLPVHIRLSGGGVVPQSPATVNLQLAYPAHAAHPAAAAEAHYRHLCALLQKLFAAFAIPTDYQSVPGSFCDGRFNLASGGRKIAGTAQYWQRRGAPQQHTVLASAVILAADAAMLTARANRLEAALHSPQRYRPDSTTAIADYAAVNVEAVAATLRALLQNGAATWPEG